MKTAYSRCWMTGLLASACLLAQTPQKPAEIWTPADLKKMSAGKLGAYGNHGLSLSHRDKNGEAELHENQTDLFVVQSGEATLISGGSIPDSKTSAPHEVRGGSISGGEKRKISAGDVVHIPAGTPHQMLVDAGKQITYFVAKIDLK